MPTKTQRFRPTVQPLEGRRLMAGDVGDAVVVVEEATIAGATTTVDVGNIINPSARAGGGIENNNGSTASDGSSNTLMIGEFHTLTTSRRDGGDSTNEATDEFFAEVGSSSAGRGSTTCTCGIGLSGPLPR